MAKKGKKEKVMTFAVPDGLKGKLKIIKRKYYPDESQAEFKEIYKEEYRLVKEKFSGRNLSNALIHKRTVASIKNKKKREKIGGSVDAFYGIIIGASKVRDLAQKRRQTIMKSWEDDPDEIIEQGLIMVREETNPQTGGIEYIPILDDNGKIMPRDNREFFKRKDGSQFQNNNYGNIIGHSYRRSVIGICKLEEDIGVFNLELSDSATELNIPCNKIVKFSAKTINKRVDEYVPSRYIQKSFIEELLDDLSDDYEEKLVNKEYYVKKGELLQSLLDVKTPKETIFFKLRNSKGTTFIPVVKKEEMEKTGFLLKNGNANIEFMVKEHFYGFTSDCNNMLKYHAENRYIDGDINKINYDEFIVLQDANAIQVNAEASMSGNTTIYVEDDSLFYDEVIHNENIIESIKVLVPSHVNIDFGQDSKLIIVGSPFQFQSKGEDGKMLWEDDEKKIPIKDFPMILAYGVFAIPEYKEEVETIDLTIEDDEINVKELFEEEPKKAGFSKKPKKQKIEEEDEEEEEEDIDEGENEEIESDGIW